MGNPIEDLMLMGKLREEAKVLNRKIVWHTLDGDEAIAASATASIFDAKTREKMEQVERLVRAIETIDGVPFSSLIKEGESSSPTQKAREMILKWQDGIRDLVYAEYRKLEEKQRKVIEDFSKKPVVPDYFRYAWKVMRGLGITLSDFRKLPELDKAFCIANAIEDEKERNEFVRSLVTTGARLMGYEEGPTKEKPIIESSRIEGGKQIHTKQVLDFEFENRLNDMRSEAHKFDGAFEEFVRKEHG